MRLVTTILFDAAGTLFRVRGGVGELYCETALRHGFHPAADREVRRRVERAFGEAFRRREPLSFPGRSPEEIGKLERRWWREVVEEAFSGTGPFPAMDRFFEELYAFFSTRQAWVLEPGIPEVLKSLRSRGAALAVVSNFDSRLEPLLEDLGLRRYFQAVVVSSLAGAAKPEPAVFMKALQALGRGVEDALHVGDDPEDDWRGAKAAGLEAVLYDPGGRRPEFQGLRLEDLSGLPGLIRSLEAK